MSNQNKMQKISEEQKTKMFEGFRKSTFAPLPAVSDATEYTKELNAKLDRIESKLDTI